MYCTQVSFLKPVGMMTYSYSIRPWAWMAKGLGNWKTMSGLGMAQPSTNSRGLGISFMSPWGAPASTHWTILSISDWASARLFSNFFVVPSSYQGGIRRVETIRLMLFDHILTVSY